MFQNTMALYQEEERNGYKYWKKKKNAQLPAFGNWDYANELPITQYFESARQAGLIRFSNVSDSEECDIHAQAQAQADLQQLYAPHFHHRKNYIPKVIQAKEYRMQQLKKENRSKKGGYRTETQRPSKVINNNDIGAGVTRVRPGNQKKITANIINVKAVDEDLYKIPPELLHSCKQKKRLGFFSRCLVPACMV